MDEAILLGLQRVGLWLALAALASLLAAALHRAFDRVLGRVAPAARSVLRLGYALAPPLVAATTVIVLSWPEAAGWFVPEHCHAAACDSHAPRGAPGSPTGLMFAAAGGMVALFAALLALGGFRAARRRIVLLLRLARRSRTPGWRVLETDAPLACCSGVFRPEVLISEGLLRRLAPADLEIVLAHERAHADRLDNLWLCLAWVGTLAWPRSPRRQFLHALAQDCEQACDRVAARARGARCVARVIRRVEVMRMSTGAAPVRSLAFRSGESAARIAALLQPCNGASVAPAVLLLCALCVLFVAGFSAPAHAFIEWLGMAA